MSLSKPLYHLVTSHNIYLMYLRPFSGPVGNLRNCLSLHFRDLPMFKLDSIKHGEFLLSLARILVSFHSLLALSQSWKTPTALPLPIMAFSLSRSWPHLREITTIIIR